jgi:ATP-dependent DNA helicase DinG
MTAFPSLQLAAIMPMPDHVIWIDSDGSINQLSHNEAGDRLDHEPVLFCHRRWTMSKLKHNPDSLSGLDLLELYAFVHPARFAVPTAGGLATALGLSSHNDAEDQTILMPVIADTLLEHIASWPEKQQHIASQMARFMAAGGWGWAPMVLHACGEDMPTAAPPNSRDGAIWTRLDEIPDYGTPPPAGVMPVKPDAMHARLKHMLGGRRVRDGQMAYAESLLAAFDPPKDDENPHLIMAEAGTGTGKTLGYLAPASVWAGKQYGTGMDIYLYPQSSASDRNGNGAASRGSNRKRKACCHQKRPGKLSLPA